MVGNDSPYFLFDLAVTYFLVGRVDDALPSLRRLAARTDELKAYYAAASGPNSPMVERLMEIRRVADDLAERIKADPAVAAETIREWQRKNIAALGLVGTLSTQR